MPKTTNVHRLKKATPAPKQPRPIPENAVSVRVPEMCALLGIGATKANELVKSGAVESVLLGKTRLVSLKSIKALLPGQAA